MAEVVANETGGRAMALEGAWGSGKSSIVEMFRAIVEAKESPRTKVMTFDAWAHRGDPLRRSFIVECFKCLRDAGWIGEDDAQRLEREMDDLAARERIQQSTAPSGSAGDKLVILISLLLGPAGLAMLSSGIEEWMRASILLVSVPLAVVVAVWGLYWMGRWAAWARACCCGVESPIGRALDWFAAKHHTPPQERFWPSGGALDEPVSAASTVRDRTSIEFRSAFDRVAGCALVSEGQRLVVVIDNLDRLDPREVLDAWSAMRLFVDLGTGGSAEDEEANWRRRVWLVVPYDPEGMRSLVGRGNAVVVRDKEKQGEQVAGGHDEAWAGIEGKSAAESFIDKTFHIRFEAPPLLMTDWREYTKGLLRRAIPAMASEEEQIDDSYRVLSLGFADVGRPPTPRELLLIVNDIAAIVMARGDRDQVPLHHIACYVWLRRRWGSAEQVRQRLLGDGGVGHLFESVAGEQAAIGVAMVLFGTSDEHKAAELLLRDPLLSALRVGSGDRLRQLANGPAFWPAFEIIERVVRNESPSFSRMALIAIDESNLMSADYRPAQTLVRRVVQRLSHFRSEDRVDRATGDAYCSAIKILASPTDTRRILEQIGDHRASWVRAGDTEQTVPGPADDHAYVLALTVHAAVQFGGVVDADVRVRVSGNDEELVAVVAALRARVRSHGIDPRRFQIVPPNPTEWTRVLRPQSKRWPWPQWRTDAILMSSECGATIDWATMAESLQEVLGQQRVVSVSDAISVGELVEEVRRRDSKAGQSLVRFTIQNGHAETAIAVLWNAKGFAAAMSWMAVVMVQGEPLTVIDDPAARQVVEALRAQAPDVHEATIALARAISRLGLTEPFSNLFGNHVTYPALIAALVRAWIADGTTAQCVPASLLAKQWPEVRECLRDKEPNGRMLLTAMWTDTGFQSRIKSLAPAARAELLCDALDAGLYDGKDGTQDLSNVLEAVSESEWRNGLAEHSKLHLFAVRAAMPPHGVRIGIKLKGALRAFADQLAAGQNVCSEAQGEPVAAVVHCLAAAQLEVLGLDVLEQVGKGQTALSKVRLACFGPAIEAALAQTEAGSFIRGAARGTIKSQDAQWIQWLEMTFAKHPELWHSATNAERTDFLCELGAALGTAAPAAKPALEGLQRRLLVKGEATIHVRPGAADGIAL